MANSAEDVFDLASAGLVASQLQRYASRQSHLRTFQPGPSVVGRSERAFGLIEKANQAVETVRFVRRERPAITTAFERSRRDSQVGSQVRGREVEGILDVGAAPGGWLQVAAEADLLTVLGGDEFVGEGNTVMYMLSVENLGPSAAPVVDVESLVPDGLSMLDWTCAGEDGGLCGNASGSGDIIEPVNLPAGGRVIFTVTAELPGLDEEDIDLQILGDRLKGKIMPANKYLGGGRPRLPDSIFIQTAAVNPEARAIEFSDELMGELIRFVSAHEVGHTLGLPHNWGSSNAVPVDSLRSPTYTDNRGTAPSIMDYARFNYVAQPGDGVTNFMPQIGTYDNWSIKWGYMPITEADTPEGQADVLDDMIQEVAGDPYYFYGRQSFGRVDPRSQNEDLGDDAVEASNLGIENLKRTVDNLVAWTYQDGEDYATLEELYGAVVNQWQRYMGHVVREIGGVYETPKTYDQDGPVYEIVPLADQEAAMEFLNTQAFETPTWMIDPDVLRRFEGSGMIDRVRSAQVGVLETLLDFQRMARMIEAEAVETPSETYTVAAMLDDLRNGVWAELEEGEAIDPYRRNLQRGYIDRLEYLMTEDVDLPPQEYWEYIRITPVDASQSDIRAYVRGELETLRGEIETALIRTDDSMTQLHLKDALARVEQILEPDE